MSQKNIFGTRLEVCSLSPMTGYFRNGCCETDPTDFGQHTICALMTEDFLSFSKEAGNDLTTPRPELGFSGLKPGDRWCICMMRWMDAYRADRAPRIIPEACHEGVLQSIPMEVLIACAHRDKPDFS